MKKILLINGPNINMLGKRNPEHYGILTLENIEANVIEWGKAQNLLVETFQSNHEGVIIDKIHDALNEKDGIIINPGAYTHYSYAIRDAIEAVGLPCVEVHLSNIHARDAFRHTSVVAPVCIGQISGFKEYSYKMAIQFMKDHL